MPLQDKLDQVRAQSLRDEVIKAAYEAIARQLQLADSGSQALKVGEPLPAFVLPNAEGRLVASDALLAHGPLVVSFFRGDWCPYCRAMLQAYEAALPAIRAAGGQLVAITSDTGAALSGTKHGQNLHYEVLSDADSAIALQCGVVFRAPDEYRALLHSRGIDLPDRHGNDAWLLPIPSTFVVDRTGIVRYAFSDIDFTYRAEPDAIVGALHQIRDKD